MGLHAFGHVPVIQRRFHRVVGGGGARVGGHLQVDADRLPDPLFPLPDADHGLDLELAEEDPVHFGPFS